MESTLAVTWASLQARAAQYLGWGRGALYDDPPWTDVQQYNLDEMTAEAIRQVNNPPVLEGETASYDWSFMKPVGTVDFPVGAQTIPLPDDFGGFEGEITVLSELGQVWFPIKLYNEGQVREQYSQLPNATGRPIMASIQWLKGTTGQRGQRAQLFLFPAADVDYTLQFAYYFLPDAINGAFPYPVGGATHASLYNESIMAVAEQWQDDAASIHTAKFMERLKASVSADRRSKPQVLGYNRDNSEARQYRGWRYYGFPPITYEGQDI